MDERPVHADHREAKGGTMNHRIGPAALVLALAGPSIVVPAARLCCDYVRPVTAVVQRIHAALPKSPRWGYALDRAAAIPVRPAVTPHGA